MIKLLFLLFIFTGCADLANVDSSSAVGGAVAGATTVKVVEKVKEVFTPHFPLVVNPTEICDITGEDEVKCYLIPCSDISGKNCEIITPIHEWFADNPKVYTLRSASVVEILNFCGRNEGSCEDFVGKYSGGKIVITKDE